MLHDRPKRRLRRANKGKNLVPTKTVTERANGGLSEATCQVHHSISYFAFPDNRLSKELFLVTFGESSLRYQYIIAGWEQKMQKYEAEWDERLSRSQSCSFVRLCDIGRISQACTVMHG